MNFLKILDLRNEAILFKELKFIKFQKILNFNFFITIRDSGLFNKGLINLLYNECGFMDSLIERWLNNE